METRAFFRIGDFVVDGYLYCVSPICFNGRLQNPSSVTADETSAANSRLGIAHSLAKGSSSIHQVPLPLEQL